MKIEYSIFRSTKSQAEEKPRKDIESKIFNSCFVSLLYLYLD